MTGFNGGGEDRRSPCDFAKTLLEVTRMTPTDVLQMLASVQVDGVRPLGDGLIEALTVGQYGAVHLDLGLRALPKDTADKIVEAVRSKLNERLPDVAVQIQVVAHKDPRTAKPPIPQQVSLLPEGTQIIAVISGKGGVGKSTVSVNLAAALRDKGLSVGILDCDIYGFSIPSLLNLTGGAEMADNKLIPQVKDGMKVMSMDLLLQGNTPVLWRGPMLLKALKQLLGDTNWGSLDVLVMDLPPGTGDMALNVRQVAPEAYGLLVTTPDPRASRVAERAGRAAQSMQQKLLGVIENMAYLPCPKCAEPLQLLGQGGGEEAAEVLGLGVLARIPWVLPGGKEQGVISPPSSPAGKAYAGLVAQLAKIMHLGAK